MTHDEMWDRLSSVVTSGGSGEILDILEEVLIGADVGVELTGQLLDDLQKKAGTWEEIQASVGEKINRLFDGFPPINREGLNPWVVLLVGVNGTGKTTTAAKLASRELEQGLKPMLVAADTFRAGAIDQLRTWAERLKVPIMAHGEGTDPAAVVYDAIQSAKSRNMDSLFIDTAGRLHTKRPLMAELEKIARIISREIESAPHETWLVMDATTGQNGLSQAREFLRAVPVTGIVLTKLDGTARGGIVAHIAHEMKLPIRFVGVGETTGDLIPFDPEDFTRAILTRN